MEIASTGGLNRCKKTVISLQGSPGSGWLAVGQAQSWLYPNLTSCPRIRINFGSSHLTPL